MKDIVFINAFDLAMNGQTHLFIEALLNSDFKVEYWSVVKCFFPNRPTATYDIVKSDYHIKIDTFNELLDKMNKLRINDTLLGIGTIPERWKYRAFFKFINKSKFFTFILIGSSRYKSTENKLDLKFLDKLKRTVIKMEKNLLRLFWRANFCDIYISPNPSSYCSRKVFINNKDYEKHRTDSHLPDIIQNKYAVFLDQYFPLHYQIKRSKDDPSNEKYVHKHLNIMCSFFTKIERQFDLKIVVALHPASKYTETDYGGRIVLKHKTCQLIQHSKFVITHGSTSISFAILRYCPLIFFYTDDIKAMSPDIFSFSKANSQLLKSPFLHVEQFTNNPCLSLPEPYIDRDACEKYKYTHMTRKEIENRENEDIIIELFKSL